MLGLHCSAAHLSAQAAQLRQVQLRAGRQGDEGQAGVHDGRQRRHPRRREHVESLRAAGHARLRRRCGAVVLRAPQPFLLGSSSDKQVSQGGTHSQHPPGHGTSPPSRTSMMPVIAGRLSTCAPRPTECHSGASSARVSSARAATTRLMAAGPRG